MERLARRDQFIVTTDSSVDMAPVTAALSELYSFWKQAGRLPQVDRILVGHLTTSPLLLVATVLNEDPPSVEEMIVDRDSPKVIKDRSLVTLEMGLVRHEGIGIYPNIIEPDIAVGRTDEESFNLVFPDGKYLGTLRSTTHASLEAGRLLTED